MRPLVDPRTKPIGKTFRCDQDGGAEARRKNFAPWRLGLDVMGRWKCPCRTERQRDRNHQASLWNSKDRPADGSAHCANGYEPLVGAAKRNVDLRCVADNVCSEDRFQFALLTASRSSPFYAEIVEGLGLLINSSGRRGGRRCPGQPTDNAILVTQAGVRNGQDRSPDGGVQCHRTDVDEPVVDETEPLHHLTVGKGMSGGSRRPVAPKSTLMAAFSRHLKSDTFTAWLRDPLDAFRTVCANSK
jgi:hypothetical protein